MAGGFGAGLAGALAALARQSVEHELLVCDSGSSDGSAELARAHGARIMGIAPEHLTRIFSHGFTTRSDGHGFGLHSGALAASEMRGTLRANSDGPGKGAIFTLELPARPKRPPA